MRAALRGSGYLPADVAGTGIDAYEADEDTLLVLVLAL